ncbi:MAG: HAMP domain-containing sensor histidine kinase [Eubacteriales bacterium]|nr:HAMP domain-containing sensor histidine kinase [Eubacteriales bacterium]
MLLNNLKDKDTQTSTAVKLQLMWLKRLIFIFIIIDIAVAACVFAGSVYYSEIMEYGFFSWSNTPTIRYSQEQLNIIRICTYVVLGLEGFLLLTNGVFGIYSVRRKLKPLDDMAAMAGKLAEQAKNTTFFDENKVHSLENAIANMTTEGPDARLHTRDSELKGIEAAINELLDRMRETYRQQSRFVSDASHELRTPIAVIQGYVNMLDRWGKTDEQILEESIEAIKSESERMKKLVEQLLFLARGDSGRNQFKLEKINLKDIAREIYEESLMIDEEHIYRFRTDMELIPVTADAALLKQAARVLADNAAKYTKENEIITVGCGFNYKSNEAFLYVQDNGSGMENEDVCHMFERFYRSNEARESKKSGMGLGLSIAQWIVGRHYGSFNVKSMKDIGTRITIVLPQKPVEAEYEANAAYIDGNED